MKKIYIFGLALIVLFLCASTVSAGLFDSNKGDSSSDIVSNENVNRYLDIFSDAEFKGKLTIVEFGDVAPNEDGSFNASQFFDKNGNPKGGKTHEIIVEDGFAMYNLDQDTKFFIISSSFDDFKIKEKDIKSDTTIDVTYYNGTDNPLESSLKPNEYGCDVSFGGELYSNMGSVVNIKENL